MIEMHPDARGSVDGALIGVSTTIKGVHGKDGSANHERDDEGGSPKLMQCAAGLKPALRLPVDQVGAVAVEAIVRRRQTSDGRDQPGLGQRAG
jgi:hypothetical protein